MLNLVGEVFQSAERNRFFWRVDNISVTESMMGDDDLGVTFSSQSSTLEEGLLIPNTLLVYKLSCFYVIDSIYNKVKSSPEVIVEKLLVFRANS